MELVKTAAYCRVSTEYEEQESSLEFHYKYTAKELLHN